MDNERDGPFKFKAGDRVRKKGGGEALVLGVEHGHHGTLSGKPYPNHLRHESGNENWWPDDELTLISPTTEPVAREDLEYRKGDRVEVRGNTGGSKWVGATYEKPHAGGYHVVVRDDGASTEGDGFWYTLSQTIRPLETEPIAAQKETKMQAYFWIAWKKDEDGKRAKLVGGDDHMWMVVAENEAEAWRKADFKLAERLELEKPDDITNFEVEVHPFGR